MKLFIKFVILFGGLAVLFKFNNLPWYIFFVILIAGVLLPELLFPGKSKAKPRENQKEKKSKGKARSQRERTTKRNLTDDEILSMKLEDLNGYEFERLVAMYYKDKGYKPHIIGGSGDHEVDIILTDPKENYKIAVQCKHWKTKNVGNGIILRLYSGKKVHKCLDAWCITTSNYTKDAKDAAEGLKIRLLNGLHVQDQIVGWQKRQLDSNRVKDI